MESSAHPGNRAAREAKADTNGHRNGQAPPPPAVKGPPDTTPPTGQADHADGLTDMSGRRPKEDGYNPFDTRRANAKRAEDQEHGSPEAATTVGGLYAAEHAVARGKLARGKGGYDAVAALGAVLVADAKAVGLIDHSPSEADVARWYADRGQTWEPTEASVTRAGLKTATKGLDPNRKIALTTIAALASEGQPWARRAIAKAEADNLDPSVKGAPHAFTLTELHGVHGATVDALVDLEAMTTETQLASLRLLRQWAAVENQRAQTTARQRLADADAAVIELPPVRSLDALLAEDDDPERMRIAEVWPSGGAKVLCAAPAGAGKTTLSGNLIRSLADGDPFLGVFEVHQRAERIVVIDNEMTDKMLRRWLRRQGVRNTAAVVDVVCLRGQGHLFDLGNDRVRDMWARRWADLGADFVIFDCVKPALEAMGLDENREMGKLLYPLTDMLAAAGVDDVLVHHHMGHQHERARGDSSALGWSDANWKIVWEGDENSRYFATAKVRDAESLVPEGLLEWDRGTNRLTYAGGNRAATATSETLEARVSEVRAVLVDRHAQDIADDKGLTKTELKNAVGGNKKITAQAIDLAAKRQLALVTKGRGEARWYRIAPKALDPLYTGEDTDDDHASVTGGGVKAAIWPGPAGGSGPSS
ncbi:AAA family ATPase [Mycobacterium persicum]|uniref:AAA family ATPase n=1 Tax=Mycobacterium persicum TaxID=1487726 RepID=UPI0009F2BB20|nr:AAA family ATPase [Mycobacterium persicum]ORB40943.1 hypothetical protein BST40_21785 [Mycobacterium persicum]